MPAAERYEVSQAILISASTGWIPRTNRSRVWDQELVIGDTTLATLGAVWD